MNFGYYNPSVKRYKYLPCTSVGCYYNRSNSNYLYCQYHKCSFNNCLSARYNNKYYCYIHLCDACMNSPVYDYDAEKCVKCWIIYDYFNELNCSLNILPMEILLMILSNF